MVGLAVWLTAGPALAADPALVAALREVMHVAVERGIASAGRTDGFLGNPAIRFGVPEPLTKIEAKLRQAGEDRRADKFVASLNHAAEIATPAARPTLVAAAHELPFEDGHRAARGDTAGTELLRRLSLSRVTAALAPAVGEAMDRSRVARQYKRFVRDSPLGGVFQQSPVDLDAYVVARTVDGLFHAIGEEERRIRIDPSARPTPRVREVFGGQR